MHTSSVGRCSYIRTPPQTTGMHRDSRVSIYLLLLLSLFLFSCPSISFWLSPVIINDERSPLELKEQEVKSFDVWPIKSNINLSLKTVNSTPHNAKMTLCYLQWTLAAQFLIQNLLLFSCFEIKRISDPYTKRLDCYIESKSSNNTYLNRE